MAYPENHPDIDYHGYFAEALARLRTERRYRVFADLERIAGRFPYALWYVAQGDRSIVVGCLHAKRDRALAKQRALILR